MFRDISIGMSGILRRMGEGSGRERWFCNEVQVKVVSCNENKLVRSLWLMYKEANV